MKNKQTTILWSSLLSHSDKAVLCLKLKSDEVETVQPTGESRSVVVVTGGPAPVCAMVSAQLDGWRPKMQTYNCE